ncbi:hypothetical protein H6G80_32420 [Nostoc sp. FACHB-87]|nr:hypothetical protein [Nostoc sp. FACHB-190]MBD2458754.1 hypothetical protein [Nostoc sp. FACHB-87]
MMPYSFSITPNSLSSTTVKYGRLNLPNLPLSRNRQMRSHKRLSQRLQQIVGISQEIFGF